MKTYKNVLYPSLNDALDFYQVSGQKGGFNKCEKECPNLLIKLPQSGVMLSIDGVSKEDLFTQMDKYGHIPVETKESVEKQIDEVCQHYIDAVLSGDLVG